MLQKPFPVALSTSVTAWRFSQRDDPRTGIQVDSHPLEVLGGPGVEALTSADPTLCLRAEFAGERNMG